MHKYLPLIAMALLVACSDTDTDSSASQGASSTTASGSGTSGGEGGAGGASGAGGAGGGAQGSGGAGGSAAMPVPGESKAARDCAPNDGPAITLTMGLAARSCDAQSAGSTFRITFYTHVDNPAGNTWTFGSNVAEAHGAYQPDGDPSNILYIKSGSLSISTWDMMNVKGSYDVTLNEGTHLAGSFDATACLEGQPLCG